MTYLPLSLPLISLYAARCTPAPQYPLHPNIHCTHPFTEELTDALRRRAALTDELMAQRESLDSLTKAHQAQTEELTQAKLRIALLTERVGELSQVVDHERAARALACEEAEARLKDREDALVKAEKLEAVRRKNKRWGVLESPPKCACGAGR